MPRSANSGRTTREWGGLTLQLPAALPAGAPVALTLQAANRPLLVEAAVAWVEAEGRRLPTGSITHGLQFTGLDWALAHTLGALLMEVRSGPR